MTCSMPPAGGEQNSTIIRNVHVIILIFRCKLHIADDLGTGGETVALKKKPRYIALML